MLSLGTQRTYGILLALISLMILGVGIWLKPKRPANTKQSVVDLSSIQSDLDHLRELAQRNSLRNTSARFSSVASRAASHLVYASSGSTGLAWGQDGSILLPSSEYPPGPATSLKYEGRQVTAVPAVWGAGIPYEIVRPAESLGTPPVRIGFNEALPPGAWVITVRLDEDGKVHFSPGNYSGSSPVQCGATRLSQLDTNIPLNDGSLGSGVFDLEGSLLGVVVRCGTEMVAVSANAIANSAAALNQSGRGPLLQSGIAVTDVPAAWASLFGHASGALVTDVWLGWAADRSGINPGDVIVSLNGEALKNGGDLSRVLQKASSPVTALVRRGRKSIAITLLPLGSVLSDTPAVDIDETSSGIELARVVRGSNADRAGLASGDRILSVNRIPASRANLLKYLVNQEGSGPVVVVAKRGQRKFVTVVQP